MMGYTCAKGALVLMIKNKRFEWDEQKNQLLQEERGLNFEAILIAIEQGHLVDIVGNPSAHHSEQQVLVVDIDDYLILVPFVESDDAFFLKTAFKSRKLTRDYRKKIS